MIILYYSQAILFRIYDHKMTSMQPASSKRYLYHPCVPLAEQILGFISHCLSIDRIKSINNVTNKDKHLRKFGTFFTWQLFKTLPNLVKRVSICVNSIQPTYIKNNIRVTAVEWSIVISGPCGNLKFLKQKNTDLSNKQTKLLDWAGLWCLQPLQQHFQPNR